MASNAYKVLGLNERQKPSFATIHLTYHALAKESHPDKNPDEAATKKFQEIQGAYALLKKEFELLGEEFNSGNKCSQKKTGDASKANESKQRWQTKAAKGRKFNPRAMSEVAALRLKRQEAKFVEERAQRAAAENDQRPQEKRRAKVWDELRKKEQDNIARARVAEVERAARIARKMEESVAARAKEVAEQIARQKKNAQKQVSNSEKATAGAPVVGDVVGSWELECLEAPMSCSSGGLVTSELASTFKSTHPLKPDAPGFGRNEEQDRVYAVADAEDGKVAEEEDLKFRIPNEFLYFEVNYLEDIEDALSDDELKELELQEQENLAKLEKFEEFWSNREAEEKPATTATVHSKKDRIEPSNATGAVREFTRTFIETLPENYEDLPVILTIEQDILERTKWNKYYDVDLLLEDAKATEGAEENDSSWEAAMGDEFLHGQRAANEQLEARGLLRHYREASCAYLRGMLLELGQVEFERRLGRHLGKDCTVRQLLGC